MTAAHEVVSVMEVTPCSINVVALTGPFCPNLVPDPLLGVPAPTPAGIAPTLYYSEFWYSFFSAPIASGVFCKLTEPFKFLLLSDLLLKIVSGFSPEAPIATEFN